MMLKKYSTIGVLPLKVICHETIISKRSKEADFNFIKSSLGQNEISDYKEINTRQLRNTERSTKPNTQIRYGLLIIKTPANRKISNIEM